MADNLPAGYDWLPLNGGENSDSNNNHKRENPRLHMAVAALTHCAQSQQLLVVRLSAPGSAASRPPTGPPGSWRSGRSLRRGTGHRRVHGTERSLPASIPALAP